MAELTILNGPNLNLLGEREPEIYGTTTLAAIEDSCRDLCGSLGIELVFRQSNVEGELINLIHAARRTSQALVINPAGLSFYSVSLVDALRTFAGPIVELHLSNIHARDELHRHSIVSSSATTVICGAGPYGYTLAVLAAARALGALPAGLPEAIRSGPA
ncbi:type II 3-dehydroquinate dehydratase [Marinibaculum pumilum]|uniref:3-dehydroquinate dehydratase n=1 Tax=Marinibaculum pumilum TaxID=1766165 RepID=A0ABV7KU39_9PROT